MQVARAEKVMTPNRLNSLYQLGLIEKEGIKVRFLNTHEYPSEFRDTTVITPVANDRAFTLMEGMIQQGYAIRIV